MNSIQEQRKKIQAEIDKLENMGEHFTGQARQLRDSAFARYPIILAVLSTFGLVATLYGFEKVIDQIPLLENNPWAVLGVGFATLIGTGALYKKLS